MEEDEILTDEQAQELEQFKKQNRKGQVTCRRCHHFKDEWREQAAEGIGKDVEGGQKIGAQYHMVFLVTTELSLLFFTCFLLSDMVTRRRTPCRSTLACLCFEHKKLQFGLAAKMNIKTACGLWLFALSFILTTSFMFSNVWL